MPTDGGVAATGPEPKPNRVEHEVQVVLAERLKWPNGRCQDVCCPDERACMFGPAIVRNPWKYVWSLDGERLSEAVRYVVELERLKGLSVECSYAEKVRELFDEGYVVRDVPRPRRGSDHPEPLPEALTVSEANARLEKEIPLDSVIMAEKRLREEWVGQKDPTPAPFKIADVVLHKDEVMGTLAFAIYSRSSPDVFVGVTRGQDTWSLDTAKSGCVLSAGNFWEPCTGSAQ